MSCSSGSPISSSQSHSPNLSNSSLRTMSLGATEEEALSQGPSVFINYRGAELRYGFFSQLEEALKRNRVSVHDDDQGLMRGESLEYLFKVIGESRIALVIFSSWYTESIWCLVELVMIKQLVEEGNLVVIPVFYKLRVSEVKELKGKFGDNFWNLVKGISDDNLVKGISGDNLGKWMEALDFVSQRIGFVFNEKSNNEADFINNIVEKVMTEIIRISIKQIEKSHDYYLLSELKKDTSTDSSTSEVPSRKQAKAKLVKVKEICSSCSMDGKVKPPNTQVFINFRGEQLRNSFVGYLVAALRGSGINVFIDNHEQRGEDLKTLFKRIEDSGIAIVVFSSKYTESKWCLDELVKIQERVDQGLLKVLPIFYKVTPDNVKRLKGEFGDHFRDKEYMYRFEEPKIKRWKEAILFVSSRFALAYDEKSSVLEIDFIDTIGKEVLIMLKAFSTVESGQSSS